MQTKLNKIMTKDLVILVDEKDNPLGTMEKMEAHRLAKLHRAVSVFIYNSKGDWLLQQRAKHKYHSNSLWTNTACTHPYPKEKNIDAANRRLNEEMGLTAELTEIFDFIYIEKLDNELTEHELDRVFIGKSDTLPKINPKEVMDYKYISYENLKQDIEKNPENYTVWFKKIFEKVNLFIKKNV